MISLYILFWIMVLGLVTISFKVIRGDYPEYNVETQDEAVKKILVGIVYLYVIAVGLWGGW